MKKFHSLNIRVYYEDTDSGGVVYYANYLKFAERARTEMLRDKGVQQTALLKDTGILFVVRSANIEIFAPARLDDMLLLKTHINKLNGASINMLQEIQCEGKKIAEIEVLVVCITQNFKPARIPAAVKKLLT